MAVKVIRKDIYFKPDFTRVLARFFNLGEERSSKIITRIFRLSPKERESTLNRILRNYAGRHRSIVTVFEKNANHVRSIIENLGYEWNKIQLHDKLLIGAYFTMEYSIESAAFFNPSIVEDCDQSYLDRGQKRVILSFRATGEGHVSSLVFRDGIIDENFDIHLEKVGDKLEKPRHMKSHRYKKENFMKKLNDLHEVTDKFKKIIDQKLPDTFLFEEIKRFIEEIKSDNGLTPEEIVMLNQMYWIASSHYDISFSLDTLISERVIFPLADTEKNGIEDARFVRFVEDNGEIIYYATYTAYDGRSILPKLLITKDFISFKTMPLHGSIANKGAALFPRKINGKYAMLCRVDGENNFIAFSDSINVWRDEVILLREPQLPWEFVQLGNCGSPIETDKGWLVITHSVGPMREYVINASLLDLNDPTKPIGKLTEPLIRPNALEREGYVPNVVYSCGSIVHNGHLIIPYAMSDYASTYAVVNLDELLQEILTNQ
ncbi:glycoside hydrolase family 130 protein [Faecalibacter rhinopitheci]|uniref:Glycoside hydrolase family 130 protein n=1 Tax=Faecalibacter rhinopitheci TaxID=2779678 RepID=A0A8J7KAY1_9FLAO|nr:glycoside hydrolase family 130 protein [Faecalibacter rhinopitheci]MBF0598015.1 glycoside hydrolase family 130 protein [Faecalibacter rhinopitheci]